MSTHCLLFEIGCEEIPARFMPGALRHLEEAAAQGLTALRLGYGSIRTFGTPRRLALLVEGLQAVQDDQVKEVRGPAERAAFDDEGKPTRAAEGFARSQGVSVDSLEVRTTPQGRYVFAVLREPGRPAAEVVGPWLAQLAADIPFPKSMRWGPFRARFARPVRWLVALLDGDVIPVEFAGVTSSRRSRGHRLLAPDEVDIPEAAAYVDVLRKAAVIVDPRERRDLIRRQAEAAAREVGGQVQPGEELLDELTYLVESPSALTGHFDPVYLELPMEVLVTSMESHQRFLPVLGPDGKLLPHFIAVSNGRPENGATIVKGNEKVLAARLADARFFFEEDRRQPLEAGIPRLGEVVFQESLGTMKDKGERLEALSGYLADLLGVGPEEGAWARRAARLAKADLVTKMVYEFPELQGVMGREYARASGEEEPVAEAIFEHLLPRFAGDRLPATRPGAVVALADRLDTLGGCFAAGLIPTGSQDPYALRRAALGAVQICLQHGFDIALAPALRHVLSLYRQQGAAGAAAEEEAVVEQVVAFIRQRLRGLLIEEGCRYDVVDAALAVSADRPVAAAARARHLHRLYGGAAMGEVVRIYQRVANLARQAEGDVTVDASLLDHPAERELFAALQEAKPEVEAMEEAGDVPGAVDRLARLAPAVDGFFDGVLVMDPDPAIRRNRLALLVEARTLFQRVADWSRVEG